MLYHRATPCIIFEIMILNWWLHYTFHTSQTDKYLVSVFNIGTCNSAGKHTVEMPRPRVTYLLLLSKSDTSTNTVFSQDGSNEIRKHWGMQHICPMYEGSKIKTCKFVVIVFYLTMHSTHFIYSHMASNIW